MAYHKPFQVTGFHSCDRTIGLKVVRGDDELNPSANAWDWLGEGVYFWEQNPVLALEYAKRAARKEQFFAGKIENPFVIGANIELGNCLNLIEPDSLDVLKEAYTGLKEIYEKAGKKMPINNDANRRLDCAVFKHMHGSRANNPALKYDTIRCAFTEGEPIYPGANFTSKLHIQICVLNPKLIKGYFLPLPLEQYNPYLKDDFKRSNGNLIGQPKKYEHEIGIKQ